MIFAHITDRAAYGADPALAQMLETMARLLPQGLPNAQVKLDDGRAWINPVRLTTKPEAECRFEAHRRYADVHMVLEGSEKIVVQRTALLAPDGAFDQAADIGFYTGEGGVPLVLTPGYFLVCWPADAHKVSIAPQSPAAVCKLVGKLQVCEKRSRRIP